MEREYVTADEVKALLKDEDKKINYNIFEQFKNIIFELYVIFEFEIFD